MRYGFMNKNGRSEVPLEQIQVQSSLKGFTSEVVATMEYKNNSDNPIEAIYVFPVDEEAAVCGFQATVDGRTIVAEIQGKQEARDSYDDAISSGHSAFLLEESDESSDIFQINVGNLPPHQSATVQLTFVTTLKVEQEGRVVFVLPTVLNPRYSPSDCNASVTTTTSSLASVSSKYSFDFVMNVECASSIEEITSPRHQLIVDIGESDNRKASIRLDKDSYKFDADLEVQVLCSQSFEPHALMENGMTTDDEFLSKSVVMVNFFPKFDSSASLERGEFIFVVDRSGSMHGSNIKNAGEALLLFLKSLPEDSYFNIVGFGSSFEKLFPKSKQYDDKSLQEACHHANSLNADLGGTEILRPLQDVFAWPFIKDYPRQVFILTDGAVRNTQQVLELVKSNSNKARCFAFGIGAGASTALVKGIARAGKGAAEFAADGENNKMQGKVIKVLKNALQPALLDCEVTWDLPGGCSAQTIPQVTPTIFSGNCLIIYGLLSGGSSIQGSITLSGSLVVGSAVEKIQHKVILDSLNPENSTCVLHRLAAKSFIQEKQDSDQDTVKDNILKLSKSANVVSKLTSFVAVDKESKQQVTAPLAGPSHHMLTQLCYSSMPFQASAAAMPRSRKGFPGFTGLLSRKAKSRGERAECERRTKTNKYDPTIQNKVCTVEFESTFPSQAALSAKNGCLELVSLQKASGPWELTPELATVFGIPLDKLKQTCPSELTTADKDKMWATALALTFLNVKFAHQKDEWEMVAVKGSKWLQKSLPQNALSYEKIMEMASSVLKE